MNVKDKSVNLKGMNPGMWACAMRIDKVYRDNLGYELIITSACEASAKHGEGSYHYKRNTIDGMGRAVDARTWRGLKDPRQIDGSNRTLLHKLVSEAAGKGFQVINEKDHLHIEMDG